MKMSILKTLISFVATVMLLKLGMAATYTVGGPNGGWDTTTDLQTWTLSQQFLVGDSLLFQYMPNHDVIEVPKADFDSCQAANVIQSYSGGSTTIPLDSLGKRYFICGRLGHCIQGMKVEIDTLATSSLLPALPVTSPVSTPLPAESPEFAPTLTTPLPTESPISIPPTTNAVISVESPSGSILPPPLPPSAANKCSFTIGISFMMIMMAGL